MLNYPAVVSQPSRKSFLNLLCLPHLHSFFLSPRETVHKASRPLSVRGFRRVYLQIIKGPERLQTRPRGPPVRLRRPRSLSPPRLMPVDSRSRGFKEQRGGCRCATARWVLICSEDEGSDPDLFHPAAQRRGFFQEARNNTVP